MARPLLPLVHVDEQDIGACRRILGRGPNHLSTDLRGDRGPNLVRRRGIVSYSGSGDVEDPGCRDGARQRALAGWAKDLSYRGPFPGGRWGADRMPFAFPCGNLLQPLRPSPARRRVRLQGLLAIP
jgi:hypothetical protein